MVRSPELTLSAHGDGTYTLRSVSNEAGAIDEDTDSGTYTVAANGVLTFHPSDGGSSPTGQVSADGNVFVLGNVNGGDEPKMYIGVRQ